MTTRSLAASLALHGMVVLAALLPAAVGNPADRPEARSAGAAVRLAPPEGTAAPTRGPEGGPPGPGEKRPAGAAPAEAVKVVVDDGHTAALVAVLQRWHGALTACPPAAPGTVRFFLYDPDNWPETRGRAGIPCADFPPQFRGAVDAAIAAEAARRHWKTVRLAVVGFSTGAPGGVVVLRIEE